jgi:two-component system sensor histidine kinase DevS
MLYMYTGIVLAKTIKIGKDLPNGVNRVESEYVYGRGNVDNLDQQLESRSEIQKNHSDTESRMGALHRATLTLFSDLSLDGVLRRIIHAARELSNARYAALGIPDGKGGLEKFLTLGLSDEEIQSMPHAPEGIGLLGEMLRTGRSIRIADTSKHPSAVGFPPGHPQMRSFLGVPIAAYGRPLGQIYLTNKIGADQFSAEDQRLIEMLASHAAAAIENARLYRQVLDNEIELAQRNLELELINALTTTVSSTMELTEILELMSERVIQLFGAMAGEIYLREQAEGVYRLAVHQGDGIGKFWKVQQFGLGQGFIGHVAKLGKPFFSYTLEDEPHFISQQVIDEGVGTLVGVPLTAPGQVMGVLCLVFQGERQIHEREVGLLEAVGAGIGIAVENAHLYRRARRLAVLEERERIAMDLHDGIIQSIYAVGLILEYVRIQMREAESVAYEKLEQAIKGLNVVIGDIRSYILDLQPSRIQIDDLEQAFQQLVREFKANARTDLDCKIEAESISNLPQPIATELFLIAQEALANVAKHAGATRVLLNLQQIDDELHLQVIDNGQGFKVNTAPVILGHGLSNMRERAQNIGGKLEIVSNPTEGTTVSVRLDVSRLLQRSSPTS